MRLTDLLAAGGDGTAGPVSADDPEITGLTADSRAVRPGYLFAAIPGTRVDGRDFIDKAVTQGAAAILAPPGGPPAAALAGGAVPVITDDNPRRRLALMAARFFAEQPRVIAAVTGTNGKTSVAWFTHQIWQALGHRAASMGTLGVMAPGRAAGPSLTTPDPVALSETLAELAADGTDHLALEASSHGLAQSRLDGVTLSAAGFTNLSRDHLDYHATMDDYRAAKLRLFSSLLPPGAPAVINADAADAAAFEAACAGHGCPILTYGAGGRDIVLESVTPRADGQALSISVMGRRHDIDLPLPGAFQAGNALCALGLVIACGDDADAAVATMAGLRGAPGRLQIAARRANGAPLYVDYAHTPDALANVLCAVRPHTAGRLIVVFGCGGDRDPGKRPMMGEIARTLADLAIVTDDNPRTEDAAAIRAEILAACPDAHDIGDRAEAICRGADELGPDDVLVIAGKGHESGQIVGAEVRPFDDSEAAVAAVAAVDGNGRAA